jgi:hypothetical protein
VRILLLCVLAFGAERELIKEDITIRSRGGASGPAVAVPPPTADAAVLKEALESLDVYRADHKTATGIVRMEAARRRLERPFPEAPYLSFNAALAAPRFDRWLFEVIDKNSEVLWQTSGAGEAGRIDWDGSGAGEKLLARVGGEYRFRFSSWIRGEERALESEPVRLASMSYREFMGDQLLEVDNALLFAADSPKWARTAPRYLGAMAGRMRRVTIKQHLYRLVLRQKDPRSAVARARARALTKELARQLVIAEARVKVEVIGEGERGDVTAVALPPEKGASLGGE